MFRAEGRSSFSYHLRQYCGNADTNFFPEYAIFSLILSLALIRIPEDLCDN